MLPYFSLARFQPLIAKGARVPKGATKIKPYLLKMSQTNLSGESHPFSIVCFVSAR